MTAPTFPYRFVDVEALIVEALEVFVDSPDQVNTETPEDFTGLLPFIRVMRISGPRDRLNDFSSVDVDVFATLRADGLPLADDICAYLTGPPSAIRAFDRVDCPLGPVEREWGDKLVRRWNATYRVVSRRRLA